MAAPIVASRRNAKRFLLYVAGATVLVCLLFVTENVTVKLLPFDNKSELAVMVDLPEGATVEDTGRALLRAATTVEKLPEVTSIQAYAGTPGAVQFQRPGAPLLSAPAARNGRAGGQSDRQSPSATAKAMPSRSICASNSIS